jgi:hypothetical protein
MNAGIFFRLGEAAGGFQSKSGFGRNVVIIADDGAIAVLTRLIC